MGGSVKQGDRVYTTGDVAKLVGVNFRTVIRWIQRGELAGYQLPGRGDHRVTEQALLAFMQKHQMPVPDAMSAVSELEPSHQANRAPPKNTSDKTVLIVEDEPAMRRAIERVFARAGWQVFSAEDGFQAGAMLMAHNPSLMTLDLKMPGMDGFDVLTFTRNQLAHLPLQIMVISAQPQSDLDRAIALGANAALAKPFENAALLAQAQQLLSTAKR